MGLRGPVAGIQPFAEISRRPTTVVYRGYDSSLDRFVLLKVLRQEYSVHEDIASRFRNEARLLARVSHPNVVAVYAYGEDDGVTYMTTEFVEGRTLQELLTAGQLPAELAAAIMIGVARGLSASHSEGVLHRDLKPENILISVGGHVKLTDFGLAVSEETREDGPAIAGTLPYMAPEIVGGEPPTTASDLFAAGTVLFELLTGRRAFSGATESEILDGILNVSPMHGVESFSDAPPALLVVCNRLLQKDPSKRPASAADLETVLADWLRKAPRAISEDDIASYAADAKGWRANEPALPEGARKSESIPPQQPTALPGRPGRWRRLAGTSTVVVVVVIAVWLFGPTRESLPPAGPDRRADSIAAEIQVDGVAELREPAGSRSDLGIENTESQEDANQPASGSAESSERKPGDADVLLAPTSVDAGTADSLVVASAPDTVTIHPSDAGHLAVALSPWASVWIDGDSVTTTSVAMLELDAGPHEVVLRNPDFPDLRRSVEIEPQQTTRLDISLWSTVARLTLQIVPWAAVEIDGTVMDTIPPQVSPIVLSPGPHRLRLLHPDYGEIQRDIVLTAGEHRELAYNMRDASPR